MIFPSSMQISPLSLPHPRASSPSLPIHTPLHRPLANPHFINPAILTRLNWLLLRSPTRSASATMHNLPSLDRANTANGSASRLPVLLFDVMGTIVRDPFYEDVPTFFGISMKELIAIKHPTSWIEFEKGYVTEDQLRESFFKDGRTFDFDGLKSSMFRGYQYLEGMEELLGRLKLSGYQMHAFANYPSWYNMIEEKLHLSKYLSWTFVSCHTGFRKPDIRAFFTAIDCLKVQPSDCLFVDDRPLNVDAAVQRGMKGIVFRTAWKLEQDLHAAGLKL